MQWYYSTPQLNNGHFPKNQAVTIVAIVYLTSTNENTISSYWAYLNS